MHSSTKRDNQRAAARREALRIALGEDDAEGERVPEAQAAHLFRRGDRGGDVAPFKRPLELMLHVALRGRAVLSGAGCAGHSSRRTNPKGPAENGEDV